MLLSRSQLIPNDLGTALSHSVFVMVFSLYFAVTAGWMKKLEGVGQKASRALISYCCHGGTNVLPSCLGRMGSAADLPGFIFINISSLLTGPSGPCPHGGGTYLCASPRVPNPGSQNQHRMLGVGRDPQRPSSPIPCSEQGQLQPDEVAHSPVQPGLERFQGWGIHHLSEQPGPVFYHPHCKIFLPYIQSKSPLF